MWLTVSEISAYGHLALLCLGLCWGKTTWYRECMQSREGLHLENKYILQGAAQNNLLPLGPISRISTTSQ